MFYCDTFISCFTVTFFFTHKILSKNTVVKKPYLRTFLASHCFMYSLYLSPRWQFFTKRLHLRLTQPNLKQTTWKLNKNASVKRSINKKKRFPFLIKKLTSFNMQMSSKLKYDKPQQYTL